MACEACKTIPPVVVEGYKEKGTWGQVGGLKTYITGSETASKGVVTAYDIFGYAPQTLQGADLMAEALGAVIVVPDFLKGQYAKPSFFGVGELKEEDKQEKEDLFAFAFNFPEHTKNFVGFLGAAKERFPKVQSWGALGLCWGGKPISLASGKDSSFKVTGQVHPAALAVDDAKAMTIPHVCLASKGEDAEVVEEYKKVIMGEGKTGYVETYADQEHGWMGARANFKDEKNKAEYERGYNKIVEFFGKYL